MATRRFIEVGALPSLAFSKLDQWDRGTDSSKECSFLTQAAPSEDVRPDNLDLANWQKLEPHLVISLSRVTFLICKGIFLAFYAEFLASFLVVLLIKKGASHEGG